MKSPVRGIFDGHSFLLGLVESVASHLQPDHSGNKESGRNDRRNGGDVGDGLSLRHEPVRQNSQGRVVIRDVAPADGHETRTAADGGTSRRASGICSPAGTISGSKLRHQMEGEAGYAKRAVLGARQGHPELHGRKVGVK